MKTNEQGEVWLDKVQAYVCPSYLNETCTDFREKSSELVYNIYQKYYGHKEGKNKSEISDELFNLIDSGKYKKRNLIKALRLKFPDVNSGVICRLIKKYLSLRILEIDRTYKTKPFVIKGKYYVGGQWIKQ